VDVVLKGRCKLLSFFYNNLVPLQCYRSILFNFWTICVFQPPSGGLETTYDVHLKLIGKCLVDFLLVLIELFSLDVTAEALYRRK